MGGGWYNTTIGIIYDFWNGESVCTAYRLLARVQILGSEAGLGPSWTYRRSPYADRWEWFGVWKFFHRRQPTQTTASPDPGTRRRGRETRWRRRWLQKGGERGERRSPTPPSAHDPGGRSTGAPEATAGPPSSVTFWYRDRAQPLCTCVNRLPANAVTSVRVFGISR